MVLVMLHIPDSKQNLYLSPDEFFSFFIFHFSLDFMRVSAFGWIRLGLAKKSD